MLMEILYSMHVTTHNTVIMSSYSELCDCHSYQCASRGSVIFKSLNVLLEGHESKGSVSNEALIIAGIESRFMWHYATVILSTVL